MIKIINIKVDSEEDSERIMNHLKRFCIENFQNKAEISITDKIKTLNSPLKK